MMQGVLGSAHSEVSWGVFPAVAVLLSPQAPPPVQLLIYQQQLLCSGAARACRQLSQPGTRRDTWRFQLIREPAGYLVRWDWRKVSAIPPSAFLVGGGEVH